MSRKLRRIYIFPGNEGRRNQSQRNDKEIYSFISPENDPVYLEEYERMIMLDLYPRKCAQCGKRFESSVEYVYRIGQNHGECKWFCGWKCLQEYRRKAG